MLVGSSTNQSLKVLSPGTIGQVLSIDGTGVPAWVATSTLFGGAPVTGSGINGYVTRWTSSTGVSTGILLDNGTVSGVNATSSSYTLNVQGNSGIAPFNVASSTGSSLLSVAQDGTQTVTGRINVTNSAANGGFVLTQNGNSGTSDSAGELS